MQSTHKGRGRGKTPNTRFSFALDDPESAIGTIVLKITGRASDPLDQRHQNLLSLAKYCRLREVYHRWYPASFLPSCQERVLYVKIPNESRYRNTVKREAQRRDLSMHDNTPFLPCVPPVEAPTLSELTTEEQEGGR